jgi:RNA polymerase sigma-70 factor, ECF subfamily
MDERKFLKAYDKYADAIFRHCYFRMYNDRELAEDIMQHTFMKTWEYISKGNDIENIRAFLYRVAHNLIVDRARKKSALSLDALMDEGFNPPNDEHEHVLQIAEVGLLKTTLAKLDPSERDIIVMRYIDDLSVKEIAKTTGETENAISVRLSRCTRKIRDLL